MADESTLTGTAIAKVPAYDPANPYSILDTTPPGYPTIDTLSANDGNAQSPSRSDQREAGAHV